MSIADLSINGLLQNVANSVVGVVNDMYTANPVDVLKRDNRYMYIALLVIVCILSVDLLPLT